MARNRETKIELTAYDDLFQTDESRAEAALSKIRDIPISEIDEFPDHPFKVLMDEDMEQLVESVKRNGVMTPATVRLKEDGRYELIIMLNQASTDRIELAKLLNISDLQLSYITNVGAGQGLLKVGSSLVPFVNKFPRNTELYKLMTTKFGEV